MYNNAIQQNHPLSNIEGIKTLIWMSQRFHKDKDTWDISSRIDLKKKNTGKEGGEWISLKQEHVQRHGYIRNNGIFGELQVWNGCRVSAGGCREDRGL